MNHIDFSKPVKTEPLPDYTPTVKKYGNNKSELTNNQKHLLQAIKQSSNINKVKEILTMNTNWLFDNTFKQQNLLYCVTDFYNADFIDPSIRNINSLGLKSIPTLQYRFDNTALDKVLVFDIGTEEPLVPFDKNKASDRAKAEFYEDVKKLADSKYVNSTDLLNTAYWYQNRDGSQIYLLNPSIGGFLEDGKTELFKKTAFDLLFN